jgi:glycosyltransferase involved in cell wall biosynthesis
MRLLALWCGSYGGGAERRFVELTGGLARRGHDVWLLSPQPLVPGAREAGARLHFVPVPFVRGFPAGIKREFLLARDVARVLRRHRPQLAYAFGHDAGPLGRACGRTPAERRAGCPFVVFVRGEELVTVNNPHIPFQTVRPPSVSRRMGTRFKGPTSCGVGLPREAPAGEKRRSLLGGLALRLYADAFVLWTRSLYGKAAAVIFQHERQRRFYVSHGMVARSQAQRWPLLPNNCNPTWMQDHTPYSLVREPRSLVAGNLYWNKGFVPLLAAFRDVRAACPPAELTVLGDGPDARPIQAAAEAVGGVVFPGQVKDVIRHLLRTRLFLFPSQVEGGSPNALLEAIEMGMPVLLSAEVAHMVGAEYPGLFRDADDLARTWVRALRDDAFCRELMASTCSLRTRYRFDWVAEAERILLAVARENGRG